MQIFKKKHNIILSYVVITIGLAIYTFAWSAFLLPARIVGGGVSGLSAICYYALNIHIPIGVMNFVFNALLLAIGVKMLGSKFGANTIYGIVGSSLFFLLWQQGLNIDRLFDVSDFGGFMCAVIGGLLCGLGIGLTFSVGGNSGGTDIIALIVSKFYNISPGKVIMLIDIIIIGCSYFISFKIENIVYGYVTMVVMTYILDMIVDGNRQSYQIMVFSAHSEEIGAVVAQEVGRGATLISAEGCYTHKEQKVLMLMVHRTDKPHVMRIIHRIDTDAFVSVCKTQGVYGKNFEKMKL